MPWAGKLAPVTGGSRGIGPAVSMALADRGAGVAISYWHNQEAAAGVARPIEGRGRQALLVWADLGGVGQVPVLSEAIRKEFSPLDFLATGRPPRPASRCSTCASTTAPRPTPSP
ncbi:MAG TPA: SDR family NAD(P)-dependent oxidoreductase [Candidatus Methylomirabilis sp.]|jgi:3-oxoacyl-[acyl-carrier protein] reductase